MWRKSPCGRKNRSALAFPVSAEKASILEHCWRAIDRSLRFGEHGLPLMGSGDWNDGMNKVGWQGSGEVCGWVGFSTPS